MDLHQLRFAPKIVVSVIFAIAVLAVFEFWAFFGFDESAMERNAFGFSRDAGFAVDDGYVGIGPAASRRFWPQRFPLLKPPSLRRIVVIGDSVMRGGSLGDSFTEILRTDLGKRCGITAEVWNLSSPGYGSRRKAIVAEKALEFHPDLVIYHAGVTTEYEDSREWERYLDYHSSHPRHWADQLPFLGRVKLLKVERAYWSWLPADVRSAALEDGLENTLAALVSKFDSQYWIPRMLPNLDRTIDEITHEGIPMIVLVHADLDRNAGILLDRGLDKALIEHYRSRPGVAIVSNREIFSSQADISTLFFDSSHWTSSGTDIVVRTMSRLASRALHGSPDCRE